MSFYKRFLFFVALSILLPDANALAEGDPTNGQRQFERKCASCHSPVAGETRLGPSLFGVVGRQSGTVNGFQYSPHLLMRAIVDWFGFRPNWTPFSPIRRSFSVIFSNKKALLHA
jgi:cytochrome c2